MKYCKFIHLFLLHIILVSPYVLAEQHSKHDKVVVIEQVMVENPRIRLVPSGLPVSAFFVNLKSEKTDAIIGAYSPLAEAAELHLSRMKGGGGAMKMRQVKKIELPAKEKVYLKPGDYHIMLINLKVELKAGDSYPVVLSLQSGKKIEIEARVTSVGSKTKDKMKH